MKQHNLDDTYELYINSIGVLEYDPTGLRNYFDIAFDPEHCYRLSIMRLPQPKKRNANKYQLALKVFPHASKQYEDAMDVTYCFTDNPNDEVPEDVAIERFIQNEQKRKNKLHGCCLCDIVVNISFCKINDRSIRQKIKYS